MKRKKIIPLDGYKKILTELSPMKVNLFLLGGQGDTNSRKEASWVSSLKSESTHKGKTLLPIGSNFVPFGVDPLHKKKTKKTKKKKKKKKKKCAEKQTGIHKNCPPCQN